MEYGILIDMHLMITQVAGKDQNKEQETVHKMFAFVARRLAGLVWYIGPFGCKWCGEI